MTVYNFPSPLDPRDPWDPEPGPHKTFEEMWDSGELPRPKSEMEELQQVLGDVPEGALPYFRLGRQYAVCLIRAFAAAHADMHNDVEGVLAVADGILQPLGEISDPELLRDFIAGAAREIEISIEDTLSPLD